MSSPAGRFNRKVTFLRRAARPAVVGTARGGFDELGLPQWGSFREMQPVDRSLAGMPFILRAGVVTVRDSRFVRALTSSDRLEVDGIQFEIQNIAWPIVKNGDVRMTLLEGPTTSTYARQFEQRGEEVTIRRIVPNGTAIQVTVRAIVMGYDPEELVAGINQGDRKILLSYEDLIEKNFPVPLREGSTDRVIVRGRAMIIAEIDDSTHRAAGTLNAIQIRATG
jgi:hypothetical protein